VLNTFLHANEQTSAQLAAGQSAPSLLHAATIVKGKEWYLFFTELFGAGILALGVAMALRLRNNRLASAFAGAFAISTALYIALTINTPLLQTSVESSVILTFQTRHCICANGLSWNTWPLVIYVVAPVLGAVIGFLLQDFLHSQDTTKCDCEDCK
jgi:glycerol uptake facilitator-like aquaporin